MTATVKDLVRETKPCRNGMHIACLGRLGRHGTGDLCGCRCHAGVVVPMREAVNR